MAALTVSEQATPNGHLCGEAARHRCSLAVRVGWNVGDLIDRRALRPGIR